jgi:GntR family transcriptional regulator/MocR family aminotransferase
LVPHFIEAVMCLAPAPGPAVQLAIAEFMRDGHYMRHLRRMKRVYAARCDSLDAALKSKGLLGHPAGLGMLLRLPNSARDDLIAREARAYGLAPSPLSIWFCPSESPQSGLLLGVATVTGNQVTAACERLHQLIDRYS